MSYIKPDYDYDPLQKMYSSPDGDDSVLVEVGASKTQLIETLRRFTKNIDDSSLHRFYGNVALSMRTNTNVFDSVAFFEKLSDGFLHTIKKTFPEMPESQLEELKKSFEELNKQLAEILKSCNVENKYLLLLVLGLSEGMLSYENYTQ